MTWRGDETAVPPAPGRRRGAGIGAELIRVLRLGRLGGLRFGESEAAMIRPLHLFRIEFRDMPWFLQGLPPPTAGLPEHVTMRWISHRDWREAPGMLETPAELVAQRFASGGACLLAWDARLGRTAYHVWVTETAAYVPWIFRTLGAPAGHLLVTDAWTHPAYRGGNMHWAGASEVFAETVRRGKRYIYAGMEEVEFFPFAAKIARMGLGICTPVATVIGVKLFAMKRHFEIAPPPNIVAFCEGLRRRYGAESRRRRPAE